MDKMVNLDGKGLDMDIIEVVVNDPTPCQIVHRV